MGVDAPLLQTNGVDRNFQIAMDAQPALVTQSNAGIPAWLSTYLDPTLIRVLVAKMKAAEIVGDEVKKGDWIMKTAEFIMIESTGEVSSYGDFNNNGKSDANSNFIPRQSYHYQTITQYGEKELEVAGLGRIGLANEKNLASILTLNKYQNKTYFFGVAGLQNYGLLNDPSLTAPIAPTVQDAAVLWADKDALGILADIQALYTQLQSQSDNAGYVELDSPMTLAMSPSAEVALTKTTNFNVNVADLLRKNFPNLVVKTAPEYSTASGELVQLMLNSVEGQRVASCAFTEKLRAHPIVTEMSAFKQKKSQGTWGTIIYQPLFIAAMLGV